VLPDLFRTASFRIALFYAGLFSLSVFVLFVIIYLATTGFTAQQLAGRVERELATLKTEYRISGRDNLVTQITARLDSAQGAFYLLEAPGGQVLAGNLGSLPQQIGWVDFPAAGSGDHIRAKGARLEDGDFLLVGLDATRLDDLNDRVIRSFLWGSAGTLVLAIMGAILMSAVSLRHIDGIVGAMEDIVDGNLSRRLPLVGSRDEFYRLAVQVNRMLDRIQALMSGLQQVSNDIAHDLKTPLTRLRHRLELVRHRAAGVADYEVAVDQALAECDLTLATFDALLRISQIEAGTRRSGFKNVDLAAVIQTLITAYQPVAEECGHRLSVATASEALIAGDPELLTQMVSNLIENAFKHTPPGSSIELSLSPTADGWRLIVADDGPGIPPSHRDKVFQRFYRLDPSRTSAGNGLGLSLVAAVIQLHGAGIKLADNEPGLRVEIIFPGNK
jgi:signal transduction histidine kinase